jgi:hypothetical protein
MTCIAVVTDGKDIVIGGDSAGVGGLSLTIRKDPKVFKRKSASGIEWVFGFTTSFRMGELIQYHLKLPKVDKEARRDLYKFMVTKFIPSLRKCLHSGGYAEIENEQESGGTFIVGLLGRIFKVGDDYQVGESAFPFNAVGCGQDIALGSLYTTQRVNNLRKRVEIALQATEYFSAGVRGPFVIIEITDKEPSV